jgi:hypothetical protein
MGPRFPKFFAVCIFLGLLFMPYAVIHPDDFGQGWNIRFTVTPVLPSLVKIPIFD